MGKIIEVDSTALQAAMLEMWWKGKHHYSNIPVIEQDLKDLDIVWAKFIGEKIVQTD